MTNDRYLVESLESGTRYATSHYNASRQKIIRRLKLHETVRGTQPRATRKVQAPDARPDTARKE